MAATRTSTKAPSDGRGKGVWSAEEKAAMRESARERKRSTKLTPDEERAKGEADIQAKFAEMPENDRAIAKRIHELVLSTAPHLMPTTYYGMPAYARDGKKVCFFQPSSKFKVRYSTLGFEQGAKLDDGSMWPIAYAVLALTPADERRITELVKKAAG